MGTTSTKKRAMPAALPLFSISGINLLIKALPLVSLRFQKHRRGVGAHSLEGGLETNLTEIGLQPLFYFDFESQSNF
jgi:hypothetical protein